MILRGHAWPKSLNYAIEAAGSSWRRRSVVVRSLGTPNSGRRSLAIYAVGEGWAGALGTGRIDQMVKGHFDEQDADQAVAMELPGGTHPDGPDLSIQSAALGWGHTAVVMKSIDPESGTHQSRLYISGRSQEFSSLLRLRRLPRFLRNYSVRQTLRSVENELDTQVDPTSLVGRFTSFVSDAFQLDNVEDWDTAREQSFLTMLTPVDLPDCQVPQSVSCSAGLTAVVTESGQLYTFGLNGFGQCGIGLTSNNVWTPHRVTGLNSDFANVPRAEMEQSHLIQTVSLGLQHGLCLNSEGEIFAFGKGDRGQLGQEVAMGESHTALPIRKACELSPDQKKPTYLRLGRIQQISSGMLHCAVLTDDNQVLLWGKNILDKSFGDDPRAVAADARLPVLLRGLPSNLKILDISCGSHHTAFLLEDGSVWGVGISSDTKEPIHEPVTLIPPGTLALPLRQFTSHMDRTTIVGNDGRQVVQVNLWKDPGLQEYGAFTPAWIDRMLLDDPQLRIREIHRSWIHSIVVTS